MYKSIKMFIILSAIFIVACDKPIVSSEESKRKYELICKHPLGHIIRYPVSFNTFWSPHNVSGGIFRFKTIDGRIVRGSFCHGEALH